ncbi:MAG: DNA polymerase III subunit delta [Nitrospinae bacterium]|nr:DNA polymerase III subunit delta [Nitrospinota bacterium]
MAAKGTNSLKELQQSLAAGKTAPIYFFHGEQESGIAAAVRSVRDHLLKTGDPSTAWRAYDLAENSFGDFLSDVLTVSFFSEKRGVLLQGLLKKGRGAGGCSGADGEDGAEDAIGAKNVRLDEKDLLALLKYLRQPSPDVAVVIAPGKVDMRQKLWKDIAAAAYTVSFNLTEDDRKAIFEEKLLSSGLTFAPDARAWMEERFVGKDSAKERLVGNFPFLDSEMIKLALYMGENKRVTMADVEECMSAPSQDNVFKLTDALAGRNIDDALNVLASLKMQGVHHLPVMGMLASHFRKLLMVRSGKDQRLRDDEIMARAGIRSAWHLNKLADQTRKTTAEQLKRIIFRLARADFRMKSGNLNEWFILEQEIVGIIAPQSKNTAAR